MPGSDTATRRTSLFAVLLLLYGCSKPGPETVAENYWHAILAGDDKKAETLAYRANEDGLELSEMIQPGGDSRVAFGGSSLAGNQATIDTTVQWVDAGSEAVVFEIKTHTVLRDGDWKVDADQTALAFLDSVYQYSLDDFDSQTYFEQSPEQEATDRELASMLEELAETQRELERQQQEGNREVMEFFNRLDEELQEEITERN